ncbi:MAG TPA: YceI family protein [Ktedonobacteraceae bacterium]|nr:YceI family protein [Ktedonobacteraceae bacterium]
MKKRYIWWAGSGLVLVIIVIIAALVYTSRFASAINQTQTHVAPGAITVTTTPIPSTGLQTFQIVSDETTASYSVYENLIFQNKPNNDAVGTTHSVQGNFKIRTSGSPLVAAMNIQVDLRTLQSDAAMRDNYVRRNTLETDTYPYATFVSVSTQGLPASYSDGQTVHFQLTGNLTMHGKTNKEVFDVQGKVVGNTITGTATSTIYMTDFDMQPPNLANIAIAQNKVVISIAFTAKGA